MTATQGQLARLSRVIFRTPRWYRSLAFAVLVAGITGIAVFDSAATMDATVGVLLVGQDAWLGIVFIGVPTIVAMFATTVVDGRFGGRLTYNQSSLLALVCEVVIVVGLVTAAVLAVVFDLGQRFVFDVLVVAFASIYALRLLIVVAVSRIVVWKAIAPAGIQTGVAAVLVFVYSGTATLLTDGGEISGSTVGRWLIRYDPGIPAFTAITPRQFVLLTALCGVYTVAVWGFLVGIDRPWRTSLGVSGLDFLRGFIGHVADGSRELEAFFESVGQEATVPVTLVSFRETTDDGSTTTDPTRTSDRTRTNGRTKTDDPARTNDRTKTDDPARTNDRTKTDPIEPGPEKACFVLPMVHPGPMGNIGGGNLPVRIANRCDGMAFVPHATAGHDFNLVSEREVDRLLEAIERLRSDLCYTREASTPVRRRVGTATMLGQRFATSAFAVNTFAPKPADDIDFAVGQSAAAELRTGGVDTTLLVDAHNCHTGIGGDGSTHVTPGSSLSYDLFDVCRRTGEALSDAPTGTLELGIANDATEWTPADGIGPLGIRVAVTRVAGEKAVYVLIDGNNAVPGVRDHLKDAIEDATGIVNTEILTSDTHIVNTTRADNRVGDEIDQDALREVVVETTRQAHADLEPVVAASASERVTVTVFGNDRTETMATQANAAVSLGPVLLTAVVLLAMAVSVLLFLIA